MSVIFGEPHSLHRYIVFGCLAGILAGLLAVVLIVPALPLAVIGAAIAGWFGGIGHSAMRKIR